MQEVWGTCRSFCLICGVVLELGTVRSGREVWPLGQSCLLSWPRSCEVGRVWLSWQWCPEPAVREPFTGRWAGASGESVVPHKVGRRQGWVLSCGEWRSGMCGRLRSLRTGLAGKGVRWRGVGERGQRAGRVVSGGQTRAGGWRGRDLGVAGHHAACFSC